MLRQPYATTMRDSVTEFDGARHVQQVECSTKWSIEPISQSMVADLSWSPDAEARFVIRSAANGRLSVCAAPPACPSPTDDTLREHGRFTID